MDDPFRLSRFVAAQEDGATYVAALSELRDGRKLSHWIWFVFPQVSGLGSSSMSTAYAINSPAEAQAYLEHPLLGPRLIECASTLVGHTGLSAQDILGATDAMKLRSSMTLFDRISPGGSVFRRVLDDYFEGAGDPATDSWLAGQRQADGPPAGGPPRR